MPHPTAEVLSQDGPIKVNAEESTDAAALKAGEADLPATADEIDDEIEGHQGKRKGGYLRKLGKAEQERDFWREEALRNRKVEEVKVQPAKAEEDKSPVKPTRPKIADFKTWEEYEAAQEKYESDRDKYHDDNLAYQLRKQDVVKQETSERQVLADGWRAQVDAAKKQFPDFEEVAFSTAIPCSKAMEDAIVTSEFGAQIAYELGQNPDEAERIAKLSPVAAIREIGKIESRIAGSKPAAAEEKDGEDEPVSPPEKKESPAAASRAPRPPVPVAKPRSSYSGEPPDSAPNSEWQRWRKADLEKKGKA